VRAFKFILLLLSAALLGFIQPAKNISKAPTTDPLVAYQWALFSSDQAVVSDLDDVHPHRQQAHPSAHINWKPVDSQMLRDVVVAVIDSGVDKNHPELKGRVLEGINFTAPNDRWKKITDDEHGHGTHIAGILAASSNDEVGVSGLSNRIKILPLKIYDEKEGGKKQALSIGQRVLAAMDAAIDAHVDVINLSLGWPRGVNSPKLEAVFARAIQQGIVVVAGAGNDFHEAQIFPCAYPNVICVGSYDIDGTLSDFSNFGGHVDILAPGQEIVSLWPTIKPSELFGPKGYEIRSGTSQAAPFVSGTAAVIKGIFPAESGSQIRARILASARSGIKGTQIRALDFSAALQTQGESFVAPNFKKIEWVKIDPIQLTFSLPVKIENHPTRAIQWTAHSLTPGVVVDTQPRSGDATITGRVANLRLGNQFTYKITINGKNFEHKVLMGVDLNHVDLTRTPPLPLDVTSVVSPKPQSTKQLWSAKRQDAGLLLELWMVNRSQIKKLSVSFDNVQQALPRFGLIQDDFDMDGTPDYMFGALGNDETGQPKFIRFFYLSQDLEVTRQFELQYEGVYPAYEKAEHIMLARWEDSQIDVKVPVFLAEGYIPKADVNPNPLAFEKNYPARRIYYLEPSQSSNGWQFITRSLSTPIFDTTVRKAVNADPRNDVIGLDPDVQSIAELAHGRLNLNFFIGQGINGRNFMLAVENLAKIDLSAMAELRLIKWDLTSSLTQEAWSLSEATLDRLSTWQTFYSFLVGRSLVSLKDRWLENQLQIPLSKEKILGSLKSFVRENDVVSFLETTDYLRAQGHWYGKRIDTQVAIYRSTFLPGATFSQLFDPVLVGRERRPGLAINNGVLFSNSLLVYSLTEKGQLVAPIENSYLIPEECQSRLPSVDPAGKTTLVFLCPNHSLFLEL